MAQSLFGVDLSRVKIDIPSYLATNANHSSLTSIESTWIPLAAAKVATALSKAGIDPAAVTEGDYPDAYYYLQGVVSLGTVCLYISAMNNQVTNESRPFVCKMFDEALANIANGSFVGELPTAKASGKAYWVHGDETDQQMNNFRPPFIGYN